MADSRNPYVMLGIPFGSPRDVATRAFARKAKGGRRRPDAVAQLTELTWALNQVEENIRDPRTAVHIYRIPADPGALEPIGQGLLRPVAELMPRATASSEAERSRLLEAARAEAVTQMCREIASLAVLPER